MVALQAPDLVRQLVLAGTGPKAGGGISEITKVTVIAYIKAALTLKDPRHFLLLPRNAGANAPRRTTSRG